MNIVTFTLPNLPPSVNELYAPAHSIYSATPRYEPKPEWKIWRSKMQLYIRVLNIADGNSIRCDVEFYLNQLYKNGKPRRVDVTNMLKWLIDTIAQKQQWDDYLVRHGSWDSFHDPDKPRARVTLTEITVNKDA